MYNILLIINKIILDTALARTLSKRIAEEIGSGSVIAQLSHDHEIVARDTTIFSAGTIRSIMDVGITKKGSTGDIWHKFASGLRRGSESKYPDPDQRY